MYSISVVLWLYLSLTSTTVAQTFASIDCISVASDGYSVYGDKTVKCSDAGAAYSSYVMTGCGIRSAWRDFVDSFINDSGPEPICVANLIPPSSGRRVQAVAQCCDIGAYVTCDTIENTGPGIFIKHLTKFHYNKHPITNYDKHPI